MEGPAYPAARIVSSKIEAYFGRHNSGTSAPLPDAPTIEAVIDAMFWASLRREEGYVPKISVVLLPKSEAVQPLLFEQPLKVAADALTRVAPAVERAGIHLGVWPEAGELLVWGTIRSVPSWCIVLETTAPGLLVVKQSSGEEPRKFINIAVLEGDQIKIIDQQASTLPDCPALVTSLLGFESPAMWTGSVNILVQLAVSMRAHGRGGSLLVVPTGSENWRESIIRPMPYAVTPPFTELAALSYEPSDEGGRRAWREQLTHVIDTVAGLTAVDGAALLNADYELLGFGAKIARRKGRPQVEQVITTEPVEKGAAALVNPAQLGGTRHLSAAQFVHDQQDAVALVASQDGRFTVFAWSPCEMMVHAHRVDVLLL